MVRTGGHDYFYYNRDGHKFLLVFGDCESNDARRFLNSLASSNAESLFNAIYTTIWLSNRYRVQTTNEDSYLLGYESIQDFINVVATETTFFGLCPFNLLCLAAISFNTYSPDTTTRWRIELDFGLASEFHLNYDPNNPENVNIHH